MLPVMVRGRTEFSSSCISRALEGGESDVVSSNHVWNILQTERPDVSKTLTDPNWYFDRKGEPTAILLYFYT